MAWHFPQKKKKTGKNVYFSLHFSPLAAGRGQDVRILHSSVPSSEEEGKTEGGGGGGEAGMHFEFR